MKQVQHGRSRSCSGCLPTLGLPRECMPLVGRGVVRNRQVSSQPACNSERVVRRSVVCLCLRLSWIGIPIIATLQSDYPGDKILKVSHGRHYSTVGAFCYGYCPCILPASPSMLVNWIQLHKSEVGCRLSALLL